MWVAICSRSQDTAASGRSPLSTGNSWVSAYGSMKLITVLTLTFDKDDFILSDSAATRMVALARRVPHACYTDVVCRKLLSELSAFVKHCVSVRYWDAVVGRGHSSPYRRYASLRG